MEERDRLTYRFEEHRTYLRGVAYRMLGSLSEADDAVQEAWLRLSRADASAVDNLRAWLTTVVARICLNLLRSRGTRREEPLGPHVPDPVVQREGGADPEREALLAESVGLALLVVLDELAPAERLAFVLHDSFGVSFDAIAALVGRTPEAARQLASRARRRVRDAAPVPDPDLARQREVVSAFFAATRAGDLGALVALLAPDVVLRADGGTARADVSVVARGPRAVAEHSLGFAAMSPFVRPAVVNGAAGAVVAPDGRPFSVMSFIVQGGRIAAIDALVDPERLSRLDLADLDE
ncbi:RNA polymerase sigma-70 factor, ECF subfamily [Nannocystis exedens]|uniref:RNA polymerase sigma-70 factor, ECF subfamily n=1 Tax=Nannocystis exedens TaxID=54 RepID=A0A1I2GZR5_9BACT|nr:RNA polymerase sigma factor SigJ [Nannocystis exedens]PCC68858.1 DNA-directed RNA polymerase sigma-70 factor [Nannocystis exedens]SFF22640.1 RNA polymerase sigma-70 factor, ECF subfamily [Nannocystis exedens]